jgi:hydrogenase maturation protein HypF
VQHHHAHLVSCLAEHGRTDEPAIGVILDGTGYGEDGTIWGGEFLVGSADGFERAGHFLPVPMPGANAAVRQPWRMAFAYMDAALDGYTDTAFPAWHARRSEDELSAARFALNADVNAPLTSSCGRLFDAVASLVGLHDEVDFEAQAAIALEFAATGAPEASRSEPYPTLLHEERGQPIILSFLPAIREIIQDMRVGISPATAAARFHAAVIAGCTETVLRIAARNGLRTVALSGGSFQNALLLEGLQRALTELQFTVLTHTQVPANDGGVSLGQAVIAQQRMKG